MRVSGRTGSSIRPLRRRSLTPACSGKVNGRLGSCLPNRFDELCESNVTSLDCLVVCMLRHLRCDFQGLEKSGKEKKSDPFKVGVGRGCGWRNKRRRRGRASDFEIVTVKMSQVLVAGIWEM